MALTECLGAVLQAIDQVSGHVLSNGGLYTLAGGQSISSDRLHLLMARIECLQVERMDEKMNPRLKGCKMYKFQFVPKKFACGTIPGYIPSSVKDRISPSKSESQAPLAKIIHTTY